MEDNIIDHSDDEPIDDDDDRDSNVELSDIASQEDETDSENESMQINISSSFEEHNATNSPPVEDEIILDSDDDSAYDQKSE